MPAHTSAFGSPQLWPLMLPNPGQTAQLRSSAAAAGSGPCPALAGRGLCRNPPLSSNAPEASPHGHGAHICNVQRGEARNTLRLPRCSNCHEVMAPGPTKGQHHPEPTPASTQPQAGSFLQRVHGEVVFPLCFGSASMSANVFCFDQQTAQAPELMVIENKLSRAGNV